MNKTVTEFHNRKHVEIQNAEEPRWRGLAALQADPEKNNTNVSNKTLKSTQHMQLGRPTLNFYKKKPK